MSKVIFILLDACGYQAGTRELGYMEHLVEAGRIAKYRVQGQLPSLSRPMYATLMTGLPAWQHGVTGNNVPGVVSCQNVFSLCREQGRTTAAAAYLWMSELYNGKGDRIADRYQFDSQGSIKDGIFYWEDSYPDSHLFLDADYLIRSRQPDFIVVHSMNIDYMGHKHGKDSSEYHNAINAVNDVLAVSIPQWRELGYDIIVTADHGMDGMGIHGGPAEEQRRTPLYILSDAVVKGDFTDRLVCQLEIAPLVCRLLGIAPGDGMAANKEIQIK